MSFIFDCLLRSCLNPTSRRLGRGGSSGGRSSGRRRSRFGIFSALSRNDQDSESSSESESGSNQLRNLGDFTVNTDDDYPIAEVKMKRTYDEQEEYMSMYCPKSRGISDASAYEQLASVSTNSDPSEDEGNKPQHTFHLPQLAYDEVVLPGSELQAAMASRMAATVAEGKCDDSDEEECVLCMEGFDETNPRMPTRCGCGENQTFFHLPCLIQWIEKDGNCPTCREPLEYEELP
mmetsp:Transcript_6839/g.14761  ORF Transcript_6839/g.14761 Transcript_6839/m.14761 type:complete len:234 (-) Transcript_6839:375-1076(-)